MPCGNATQKGIGFKNLRDEKLNFWGGFCCYLDLLNLLFSNLSPVTVSLFSRLKAALVDFRVPVVLIYLRALLLLYVERIKRHAAHRAIKTLWL